MSRIIFRDIDSDDMILAMRAVKWLEDRPDANDSILCYGEGDGERCFYVKRNKTGITVRPT